MPCARNRRRARSRQRAYRRPEANPPRVRFPPRPFIIRSELARAGSAAPNARESAGADRAPDRDGDVPLHGHRGVDTAAAGPGGRVRGRARRAPPGLTEGLAGARRRRGRHSGRRVLRRLLPRVRCRGSRCTSAARACWRPGAGADGASHTGEPLQGEEGYVGFDVHRAARIAAAGHGGQVLLSQATADLAGARCARSRPAPAEGPQRAGAALPARDRGASRR